MPYPDSKAPAGPPGPQGTSNAKRTGPLMTIVFAAIAALAGWKAAGAAFQASFNAHDNHDSAAPLLLASPIALGAFCIVATLVFATLKLAWKRLRQNGGH